MPEKTAPSFKIIFQVLHKTWYLFFLIFLLNLENQKIEVSSYYDNKAVSKNLNFQLLEMSREKKLSVLKGLNPSKAAVIDNLSNEFLKDSADVLA